MSILTVTGCVLVDPRPVCSLNRVNFIVSAPLHDTTALPRLPDSQLDPFFPKPFPTPDSESSATPSKMFDKLLQKLQNLLPGGSASTGSETPVNSPIEASANNVRAGFATSANSGTAASSNEDTAFISEKQGAITDANPILADVDGTVAIGNELHGVVLGGTKQIVDETHVLPLRDVGSEESREPSVSEETVQTRKSTDTDKAIPDKMRPLIQSTRAQLMEVRLFIAS